MTQHWFRLYVQRIDTTKNIARFYAMSIEPDLFGGSALVRHWGRIGTRGQERIDLFTDDLQATRSEPAATCPPALLISEGVPASDIEFVRTLRRVAMFGGAVG